MNILSLCDYTGNMVRPWAEAGHICRIVDIQHRRDCDKVEHLDGGGVIVKHGLDILAVKEKWILGADVVFAFPPCTDLAVSGARWWAAKGADALVRALELVSACRSIIEQTGTLCWMIENPVGRLSRYWRKPDFTFNPCDYGGYLDPPGDAYTKRTCLWTGPGFIMPTPRPVEPVEGSKMHLVPPGPNRANIRSATPTGFARAVFEANAPRCPDCGALGMHFCPEDGA